MIKSRLERTYRQAHSQGLLPYGIVDGESNPDVIFGRDNFLALIRNPNSLEKTLVSHLSPYSRLRRAWNLEITLSGLVSSMAHVTIGAGICAVGATLCNFYYFGFWSNEVYHACVTGGGILGALSGYKNFPRIHDIGFQDFTSEPLDMSKNRTDLSTIEPPVDTVQDGNVTFGKRYLEARNE